MKRSSLQKMSKFTRAFCIVLDIFLKIWVNFIYSDLWYTILDYFGRIINNNKTVKLTERVGKYKILYNKFCYLKSKLY